MPSTIYHSHHIVPRHAGGTDDPSNLIKLTIPGHAFAHWCLWMKFGQLEDKVAWLGLDGRIEEMEVAWRELARSPRARAKMSAANKGRAKSAEACAKMSAAHKGVKLSFETCAKMSRVMMGNKHGLGYKHTLEARAKIITGLTGRSVSQETRDRISKAMMGNMNGVKKS